MVWYRIVSRSRAHSVRSVRLVGCTVPYHTMPCFARYLVDDPRVDEDARDTAPRVEVGLIAHNVRVASSIIRKDARHVMES